MMSLYKRIFPFLAFMSVCGCQLESLHVNGDECSPSFSNGMSVETGSITCYKDHMESICLDADDLCLDTPECSDCKRDFNDCKRYQADFDLLADNALSPNRLFVSAVNRNTNLDAYQSLFYNGRLNACPTDAPRCAWAKDDDGAITSFECLKCIYDICGTDCVDLQTNINNCGACGRACKGGSICDKSQCVCPPNQILCDDRCIDPMNDGDFCGAKNTCKGTEGGRKCSSDQTCIKGTCTLTTIHQCKDGQHVDENGNCEDDTPSACGDLKRNCQETVQGWLDGECRTGGNCYATQCDETQYHVYDGKCEQNDNANCGSHDTPCESPNMCTSNGECKNQCNDDETICEVAGKRRCIKLSSNPEHCGECNNACIKSDLAGIVTCDNTMCIEGNCKSGSHFNKNTNRCEPDTDLACGEKLINCNNAISNSEETFCENAVCKLKRCKDGFHVDSSKLKCVEDTISCCGTQCSPCLLSLYGKSLCKNGKCDVECNDGYTRCETPSPYCTDLNDASACGSCTNQCTEKPANATAVCINKNCSFKCNSGYAECTSGQCVSTNTTSHCGTCNNRCPLVLNGSSSCDNGKCIITCKFGYLLQNNKCVPIGSGCPSKFIDCNFDGSRCCKTLEACNDPEAVCLAAAPDLPIQ